MNKDILRLAIPNIISNITVPLLSMVDMSIVGHLKLEIYIGAIATSTLIFNFIYWSFSFLRMGTSGFTAQAYGAADKTQISALLLRSVAIALTIGLFIIIFQSFIFKVAFHVIKADQEVMYYARKYFNIYIWAAPAVLSMYAFSGWFVGMQDAKTPMAIAIVTNIVNVGLSLFFVYVLKMELEGVALGSTIAQLSGFLLAFTIWYLKYKEIRISIDWRILKNLKAYVPFFRVNTDIFIRTMLLICVTTFFTSTSVSMGNQMLAANALLMQMFVLFSYMMDGFAYAAEALTGRFVGAGEKDRLGTLIKKLFLWGLTLVVFFTLIYAFFTDQILRLLTDKEDVVYICKQYHLWVLLIPIAGFSAFLWDGVFIGATASKQMRNSMLIAVAIFFVVYYTLHPTLGNNALWLAFITYLSTRGFIQALMYKSIKENVIKN